MLKHNLNKQQMKLIETKKGLMIQSKYGEDAIHTNHTYDTLKDFRDDIWAPYMVAEECTNYAMVHLITASSEDHALEQVDEYLREKVGVEETHLIIAEKLDLS
jgi:hypothetical protein